MKNQLTAILAILGFAAVLSGPGYGAPAPSSRDGGSVVVDLGLGLGTLRGNTLYHISSYNATGGVESELEFPLETVLIGLEGSYIEKDKKGRERLSLRFHWFTNVDNGSGVLKDSDWLSGQPEIDLVGASHPGLDIYSESDISLKTHIIDVHASYKFWPSDRWCIGPLAGFLFEKFSFDASNVSQVGYGPYAGSYTQSTSGPVLTYEVTYVVPYVGVHAEARVSRSLRAGIDLGFSPVASASDEDDHLLRTKVARGSTTGTAYLVTIAAIWDLRNNDFLQLRGQHVDISTTGTQSQSWYGNADAPIAYAGDVITGIDDRIESRQTSAYLLFSHRF